MFKKIKFAPLLAVAATLATVSVIGLNAEAKRKPAAPIIRTPMEQLADAYNYHFYFPFVDKLAYVRTENAANGADQNSCNDFYAEINQKKTIKIVVGLGYYDSSEGEPFSATYYDDITHQLTTYDFGMNATVDIANQRMYGNIFTRPCSKTSEARVCGFTEVSPGVFKKIVKNPAGKKIEATIEMKNSSVTPIASENVGASAVAQQAKSDATTRWFFGAIPSADLVIYNGHSRKGGGPDFSPPKLRSNLHVNYPYYAANTPGLNRLLDALSAPHKPKALMMMSCNSTTLFAKRIAAVAPNMSFTGTDEVIPGDIPTKGTIAGIDSMLRFQCESGFNSALSTTPEIAKHITPLRFK